MNHDRPSLALLIAFVMVLVSLRPSQSGAQSQVAAAAPLGASFTYQGKLIRGGNPVNGTCDFEFRLWDAATGGAQLGSTQTKASVTIVNGLFTVALNFGQQFTGDARWLATAVKCPGDGSFTALSPRQALTAAPYALSVQPGAHIDGAIAPGTTSEAGLRVTNSAGIGVRGATSNANSSGVEGNAGAANAAGVLGLNTSGPGVWGRTTAGGAGVYGQSSGFGIYGDSPGGFGVYGTSPNGGVVGLGYVGVQGNANNTTDSQGVRGDNGGSNTVSYAGLFNGRVSIFGNLSVFGTLSKSAGAFKIDHPLDPANKYLMHSFVESPDMKNIYDGIATLDDAGQAVVQLPDYFEALNMDFRYQLTCIGGYAPVFIGQEIAGSQFTIAGGTPGLKISWQVTGIRHDPYANANRIPVEEDKAGRERGTYLYPQGYGRPQAQGLAAPPAPAINTSAIPAQPESGPDQQIQPGER